MVSLGVGVILIMAVLAAFAYVSFTPMYANKKALKAFNQATLVVVVVLTGLLYLNGKTLLPVSSDSLREMVSLIFAFLIELFLLVLLFVVRNYWIFKPPRR